MDLIVAHHNLSNSNQLQAVPHLGQQAVLPVLQHQLDLLNCHLTITSLRIITEVFKEVELFVGVGISYTIWLQPNPTHQQRLLSILLPTTMMKISMIPFMDKISPSYRYRLFCSSSDWSHDWSCDWSYDWMVTLLTFLKFLIHLLENWTTWNQGSERLVRIRIHINRRKSSQGRNCLQRYVQSNLVAPI